MTIRSATISTRGCYSRGQVGRTIDELEPGIGQPGSRHATVRPTSTAHDHADTGSHRRGAGAIADELDQLTPEQLATPSLCGAWSVHDVAAHLVMPLTVGMGTVIAPMAASLGNFDKANIKLTANIAARSITEITTQLRARADNRALVRGDAADVLLAMCGRKIALDKLTGDGVTTLRNR